ncbi:MAG: hypothetical protein R2762_27290 [Bryobacteraceae bacterium]
MTRLFLLAALAASTAFSVGLPMRFKMTDFVDRQGFERPVVALRLLVPAGWKTESNIQWNPQAACAGGLVTVSARVTSPDGRLAFEMFPNYIASWGDGFQYAPPPGQGDGCRFHPPFDARQFLGQILVPGFRRGATMKGVDPHPETARVLQQKHQQQARQMGSMAQIRSDAAVARLEVTENGSRFDERITASTFVIIGRDGAGGGVYTSAAESVFAYRAPVGELARYDPIFATIMNSLRVNPAWKIAINRIGMQLAQRTIDAGRVAIQGIMARSQIMSRALSEAGDIQMRTWRNGQQSNDRMAESFSRYIRDVDLFQDSKGGTMEFGAGTQFVWSNGGEEYIATDDSSYDPGASLPGPWNRYEVKRGRQ